MTIFDQGKLVLLRATFKDPEGALIDPEVVMFKYQIPGSAVVSKTYETDPEVVREELGKYHIAIDTTTTAGVYKYRIVATGLGQSAEQGEFYVEPKNLA